MCWTLHDGRSDATISDQWPVLHNARGTVSDREHRILGCKDSKQSSQQLQVPSNEGGTTSVEEDAACEGSNVQAGNGEGPYARGEHERLRCKGMIQ